MLESLRAYCRALGKGWYLVILGLVSGGLGLLQDLVNSGIVDPVFDGRGLPSFAWYALLLVAIAVAPFAAFHKLRIERDSAISESSDLTAQVGQMVYRAEHEAAVHSLQGEVSDLRSDLAAKQSELGTLAATRPSLRIRGHKDEQGRCYAIVTNQGGKAQCQGRMVMAGGPIPREDATWQDIVWGVNNEKGPAVTILKGGEQYVFLARADSDPIVTGREYQLPERLVPPGLSMSSTGWSRTERWVGLHYHIEIWSDPPAENEVRAAFVIEGGELKQVPVPTPKPEP